MSKSPFSLKVDLIHDNTHELNQLKKDWNNFHSNYTEKEYDTFDEYFSSLKQTIENQKPQVVILAAAVSDYGVKDFVNGKIRSKSDLTIELQPLPKVISFVKQWMPKTFLVGFKMLVGDSDEELINAANKSINDNDCDMVIANDWNSYLKNNPRICIIQPSKEPQWFEISTHNLAAMVVKKIKEAL